MSQTTDAEHPSVPIGRPGPVARPIPEATWQAHVVDAGVITKELNRLWAHVSASVAPEPEHPRGTERSIGVLARASTLNLTAVARTRAEAARAERTVMDLSDLSPSRATILVADPERTGGERGMDVRVALLEQPANKGRPAIRFELVTVAVNAGNERQLASIASPLLVADLPDFLWWASASTVGSELFADLTRISDRLIVDTAACPNPAEELRNLATLLQTPNGLPRLSDFAWVRLRPWRQIAAQFFDAPAARSALDALDGVQVLYGAAGRDGRTGFTGALLLAGWLGSRLGWSQPGELVRSRAEEGIWRATLRAGKPGNRREVVLTVRPAPDPIADCGLAALVLSADAGRAGTFRIERFAHDELATIAQIPGTPISRRMVYALLPNAATALAEELRAFSHDLAFEAALAFATTLAPNAVVHGDVA
ncbi:MAG: glucose-6-phosphate dehydrogenase assembly protein OpcA [Thermomicrobiales bacterium]|nr:glucose-6-phosphate dehydrogenase assembly protein OpcA [Thermomicrobiales bacterium]